MNKLHGWLNRLAFLVVNRGRYQFLAAVFFAIIVPLVSRLSVDTPIRVNGIVNTLVICSLMLLIAFLIWRQLYQLPSVSALMYVFWSFLPVYALTLFIITMARIDYNRYLLLMTFVLSVFWFMFVQYSKGHLSRLQFLIIPGGNAERVMSIDRVDWAALSAPEEIPESGNSVLVEQSDVENIVRSNGASGIVADLRHNHDEYWERFMTIATLLGVPVYHYKQLEERLTGRVSIDHLSENSFGSVLPDRGYLKVKQVLDFALAILLLPLFLPVMLVVGILIRVKDGGPVLFRQERIGYRGEIFTAYKFRTMRESDKQPQVDDDRLKQAQTVDNDPRITEFGAFLRRTRLDEFPQIFNILKGEMSWIGPRPEVNDLAWHYESRIPFYAYRHAVRPGISGWAQVMQGHVTAVTEIDEKLKLDFFYIKNVSLLLDFLIGLKTFRTVIKGKGAR